uniref:bile salt-activated lipase-like n=1 Tax=Pristiophorus japonicus TaxID=55135 RepID=UPI00398E78DE
METVLLVMLLIALGPGAQAGSLYTLETEILKENSVEFKNPVIPEGYDCAESIGGPEGIDTRSLCENPEGVIVQTKYGPVRGSVETVDDKTINIFKGIPFAAPPERFQKPKPPKSWTDVLDTTKFGAFCLQMGFGSEDCLFLNVWSPQSKGKNLPVMVWIYGGAFITGSSSSNWYKRAQVAARGDVVVVSFNYRVGPLGFLSTGDANAPGNYGLWDQHEAITWVSRNIKAFGGDPNSITLFGESAGAASVNFQIQSPYNKGIIKRAISESGVANSPFASIDNPLQTAKHFRCPTNDTKTMINCFRKVNGRLLSLNILFKQLSPAAFVVASPAATVATSPAAVVASPAAALAASPAASVAASPAAAVAADLQLLLPPDSPSAWAPPIRRPSWIPRTQPAAPRRLTPPPPPPSLGPSLQSCLPVGAEAAAPAQSALLSGDPGHSSTPGSSSLWSGEVFPAPTDRPHPPPAEECRPIACNDPQRNANTYSYVFSYAKKTKGADHADELPYVFGIPFETKRYYSRTDRKISEYMIGYWTNFAHTGNPNKGSSAVPDLWQPYTISDAYYLEINNPVNKASVKQHLRKDFVKFWVDVFPKL